MIKEITKAILSDNKINLSQIETREIFDEIYQGMSTVVSSAAFVTAFEKINKSDDILQAVIEASKDAVVKPSFTLNNAFQVVNLGYSEKVFDVYFALDIINSANNIKVIKYGSKNLNNNYTFNKYCTNTPVYSQEFFDLIEKKDFCYYHLDESEKYIKYTDEIRKNIDFENIFDFVDYFLNPFDIKNNMIGTVDSKDVENMARLALLLKYDNTLVVSSSKGVPYAVLDGENTIAEAWKNKIFTYTMDAKLLDLPVFDIEEINVDNNEHSLEITKEVFKNKTKNAYYCTIILNAGLSLYISKNSPSLVDGIKLAQKTIDDGLAYEKLLQIENVD